MTSRKIMLLGEIGVGKSSLVRRLVLDRFEFDYKPTLGVDVYTYVVPATPARPLTKLIIWDTDGNAGTTMFQHVYMRQASAALIVADITRPATLQTMAELSQGFRDAFPGRYHALVLNKLDLKPPDGNLEALKASTACLAADGVFETSAKTGDNVKSAFHSAADTIMRRGQ